MNTKTKKIIVLIITLFNILLIFFVFYLNDMQMNYSLELTVPKMTRRELIKLESNDFFDDEMVLKIYLSKYQMDKLLKVIKKNNNWQKKAFDEKLDKLIKQHTRENIYYKIPKIDNPYWIFSKRTSSFQSLHDLNALLNEEIQFNSISIGILDLDNSILYYYEYDT